MQRSIDYNNAGVDCTAAGHHRIAWELFKGALEVKLATERSSLTPERRVEGMSRSNLSNDSSYIQKAERHMQNLPKYVHARDDSCSRLHNEFSSPLHARQDARSTECLEDLYSPYLFREPMKLRHGVNLTTRKESATIIFNLALVDHLKNRCSEQAVQLYELAMTLLTGDVVDLLGIALMNNIGVWCYENGDLDGTITCMGHLASFLGSSGGSMNQSQKEGLQSNILWLTNPTFAASPAA